MSSFLARKSKMESHPEFQKIIEAVINNRMTGRVAAKKLGSTEPNFSQYMSRHYPKHKPKRKTKKRKTIGVPSTISSKEGEAVLTISLDDSQTSEEWGTAGWRLMVQNLISTISAFTPEDDTHELVKLIRALTELLKFQFSHKVPDIPRETVKIDEEMAKEIIDKVMEDHDTWCKYRNDFIKRKDREQVKARLEPTKPSLME